MRRRYFSITDLNNPENNDTDNATFGYTVLFALEHSESSQVEERAELIEKLDSLSVAFGIEHGGYRYVRAS